MKVHFIAEIGSNHFGSLEKFKELIVAAVDSGANFIKSQLYNPYKISGSMPQDFYWECSEVFAHKDELEDYALEKGAYLFWSCWHEWEKDEGKQFIKKISASQSEDIFIKGNNTKNYEIDSYDVVVSVRNHTPMLNKAVILYATEYLPILPGFDKFKEIRSYYASLPDRKHVNVGYSDHTKGIGNCCKAIESYGANFIEKHFTLKKSESWVGYVFRDTIHGATPREFYELTRRYK